MSVILPKCTLIALVLITALVAVTAGKAQRYRRRGREVERTPPVSVDRRDRIVAIAGPFNGRPYWLALAQCGGIYFKLNTLYTDAAVRARVVRPDPGANAEFTRKLNEAINTATLYLEAAETFLETDRGLGRDDAILTYDGQSRAAGDRVKTIDAALAAAKACPALYGACRSAYAKACSRPLAPVG
ncbi:MAG: hypothetical protein WBF58_20875 [Xanthobacteraceae bacterium]